MSVKILSTGSEGNCVIIHDRIIIDAGITKKAFLSHNIPTASMEAVFVSHKHSDHANKPFIRYLIKSGVIAYLPPGVIGMLMEEGRIDVNDCISQGLIRPIQAVQPIEVNDLTIIPHPQRHSTIINFAFEVLHNDHRLLYSTDLDTLEPTDVGEGLTSLGQFDTILLEGNYDEVFLREYIQYMVSLVNTEESPELFTDDELDKWVRKNYRQLPPDVAQQAFRAIQNRRHLSKQQARAYVATHLKPNGDYYEVHRSSQFYSKPDDWEMF